MGTDLRQRLRGVIPPLATPFEKGEIAPARLKENIGKLAGKGLAGFLVLGSNGEAPLLREEEKLRLVEAARSAVPAGAILMVGAGRESTAETIRSVNQIAGLGADCALLITPSYYPSAMTTEALHRHYLSVAEGARIPILLYIVPQFAGGVVVDSDTVARLAEHPNIAGLKDSSGHMERFAGYVERTPAGFAAFAGNAATFHAALELGAAGAILAVANILPETCVRLMERHAVGEKDKARRIQKALVPIAAAVTTGHGIAGLKAAMDRLGFHGGDPRLPLLPVSEEARARIGELLRQTEAELAGL